MKETMDNELLSVQLDQQSFRQKYMSLPTEQMIEKLNFQLKSSIMMLNTQIPLGTNTEIIFFKNYETLISIVHEKYEDIAINLSIHWVNIYGQRLLEKNNIQEATVIFQLLLNYQFNHKIDSILACTGLNNLSLLYQIQQKYRQALKCVIKTIDLSSESIKTLQQINQSQIKNQNKIQILSIIMVNSFKNGKFILKKLIQEQPEDFCQVENNQLEKDKQLLNIFNRLGYESCLIFLGRKSQFFKYFKAPLKKQINKIIQQKQPSETEVNQKLIEYFETSIVSKLNRIQKILKEQSNGQTIKITQVQPLLADKHQSKQIVANNLQSKEQNFQMNNLASGLLSYFSKGKKIDQQIIQMRGWVVQMELNKLNCQRIGKLQILCNHVHKKISFLQKIQESKLYKLLHLISLEDTISYENNLDDLPYNFIEKCIKPYFNITQEGIIQFYPRSKGIFQQFKFKNMFKTDCLIALNHIKANQFRASISPMDESGSLYLNISLCNQSLQHFFEQLIDPVPQKIVESYRKTVNKRISNKQWLNKTQKKSIKIKNKQEFQRLFIKIMKQFQRFIANRQQNNLINSDIYTLIQKQQFYFKFQQIQSQTKGSFYEVLYLKTNGCFSLYAEACLLDVDNFQNNQKIIKGRSIFVNQQILQYFAIQINTYQIKSKTKLISEILCLKYFLNFDRDYISFKQSESHYQQTQHNSMLQRSFNFHSFQVKYIKCKNNDYLTLITVSLLTINNQIPIGIRVQWYDPAQIMSKGFFIYLYCQDWCFQNFYQTQGYICKALSFLQTQKEKIQMFIRHQQKYSHKVKYFIGYWLEHQGFEKILQEIINQSSNMSMQKNLNKIINLSKTQIM